MTTPLASPSCICIKMLRLPFRAASFAIKAKGGLNNFLTNESIKLPQILLINEKGEREGPMSPTMALSRLDRRQFDLVLVNSTHEPPIAKAVSRSRDYQRLRNQAEGQLLERMKRREKEVRFGTAMAEHDIGIRMRKVEQLLEDAYRVKLVVEGGHRKAGMGGPMEGKERMHKDLMDTLRERYGKNLVVMAPPESLFGNLVTVLHHATAQPPSTKPKRQHHDDPDGGSD